MRTFNIDNAHPRDARLLFEEDVHRYTLRDTGEELLSVTSMVEECFEPFDADYWAAVKAPAMGMKPDELKELWRNKREEAASLGSEMHSRIEAFYLGCDCGADDEAYRHFKTFENSARLCPYRTEWRIYHEEAGVAGTLDMLAVDRHTGHYVIYDWKRSDKIVKNGRVEAHSSFGRCACPPVAHLSDTAYAHYALQVSIYRLILSEKYGIEVESGHLGVFHPTYTRPYLVEVPYLRQEARILFDRRINNLINTPFEKCSVSLSL